MRCAPFFARYARKETKQKQIPKHNIWCVVQLKRSTGVRNSSLSSDGTQTSQKYYMCYCVLPTYA